MADIILEDNNSLKKDIEDGSSKNVNVHKISPEYLVEPLEELSQKRVHDISGTHPQLLLFMNKEIIKSDPYVFQLQDKGNSKYRFYTGNVLGFLCIKKEGKPKSLQVKIRSRFDSNENDFFLHYLLQKVANINIFDGIEFSKGKLNAFDLLMLMFPSRLKAAYAQGLYREYQTFKHNDANIHGVIDVPRHIRRNMPFQGKVAYNTREYTRENPLMQLVRHTIECIESRKKGRDILGADVETRAAVNCVRQFTPRYSRNERGQVIADNLRPVAHPFYTAYKELQDICLRILRQERLSYGKEKETISGILFDGAWLWEEYIAKLTSRFFKHYTNGSKDFFLFKEKMENGFSEPFQWIIPDYLGSNGSENIIADAKYIPLSGKRQLPAEQAEGVYYKTVMYMLRFKAKKAFLFYPYTPKDLEDEAAAINQTEPIINDFVIDGNEECHLYKIGLPITKATDFKGFAESMRDIETKFQRAIEDKLK